MRVIVHDGLTYPYNLSGHGYRLIKSLGCPIIAFSCSAVAGVVTGKFISGLGKGVSIDLLRPLCVFSRAFQALDPA